MSAPPTRPPGPGGLDPADLRFALGDDLEIRPVQERDAEELHELVVQNRAYLSEWLPWAPGQTLATTREFIVRSREQLAQNQGFQASILREERIIGGIGFHLLDWQNRSTSIGYWLAEAHVRQGIMTRAVRTLVQFAFDAWQLHRVEIRAGVENARSRAVPERLGFVHEGVARDAELVGGRFIDLAVYAMLAPDWRARE